MKKEKKGQAGLGQKMTTYEMNFEDLQSKYQGIRTEYSLAKDKTIEL